MTTLQLLSVSDMVDIRDALFEGVSTLDLMRHYGLSEEMLIAIRDGEDPFRDLPAYLERSRHFDAIEQQIAKLETQQRQVGKRLRALEREETNPQPSPREQDALRLQAIERRLGQLERALAQSDDTEDKRREAERRQAERRIEARLQQLETAGLVADGEAQHRRYLEEQLARLTAEVAALKISSLWQPTPEPQVHKSAIREMPREPRDVAHASIDAVVVALLNRQTPPADERRWVLVELNPDTAARRWTTNNLTHFAASEALFSISLELHARAQESSSNSDATQQGRY